MEATRTEKPGGPGRSSGPPEEGGAGAAEPHGGHGPRLKLGRRVAPVAWAPPMPPWPSDLPSVASVTQRHPPSLPESSPRPRVLPSVPKAISKAVGVHFARVGVSTGARVPAPGASSARRAGARHPGSGRASPGFTAALGRPRPLRVPCFLSPSPFPSPRRRVARTWPKPRLPREGKALSRGAERRGPHLISHPRGERRHRPRAEPRAPGPGPAVGGCARHLGLARNWRLGRFILAFIVFPSGQ